MKKTLFSHFLFLIALGLMHSTALRAETKVLKAFSLDFDNTVMHTDSQIHLFHYDNGQSLPVSTGDFAEVKSLVSAPGPYQDFRVNYQESFREFRDSPYRNVILDTIKSTVQNQPEKVWQGPAWEIFVNASNNVEQAHWLSIITARGHASSQFRDALGYLSSLGYFQYLPRQEYIFNVGSSTEKDEQGKPKSIEQLKVEAMVDILDDLEKEVVRRRAQGEDIRGEFVFYDDDRANVDKAKKGLEELVSRWPDVDLHVSYVGTRQDVPAMVKVERPKKVELNCRRTLYH